MPNTPPYRHKRPAPRKAAGAAPQMMDTITWHRILAPNARERYRIVYIDGEGHSSERTIELTKVGTSAGSEYLGVIDAGKVKTFKAARVLEVLEQLTTGHAPSIFAQPGYATLLPSFPIVGAVYKVPTVHASNRTWTVDLNLYTCTCPEQRIRGAKYKPGQLGYVCPHMARAILDHLPEDADGWTPAIRRFLADTTLIHIDNLS